MKRFALYFLLFAAILVVADRVLARVCDYLYSRTLTGQTGGKLNHYLSLEPRPTLVVMGNSRAYYQVIPDSFGVPTYNLCHAGMSQVFQTGLLDVLAQQERLPKAVLLHLDPYDYTSATEAITDIQNLKYYFRTNPTVARYTREISVYEPYKYWLDLYRYNGRIISLAKNYLQTRRTPADRLGNGYDRIAPTPLDSLNTIYSARKDPQEAKVRFHYDRLRHLDAFLEICRRRNVRVVAFTSPVFEPAASVSRACQTLDSVLNARQVPYIDYVNQPLPLLQRRLTYWKDNRHLNELGAKVQSHDLARRVQPWLGAAPTATIPPYAALRAE